MSFLQVGDLGLDLLQRPGRNVLVEMPRQRDFIADLPNLAVLFGPSYRFVDPGIGNVRLYFAVEILVDALP